MVRIWRRLRKRAMRLVYTAAWPLAAAADLYATILLRFFPSIREWLLDVLSISLSCSSLVGFVVVVVELLESFFGLQPLSPAPVLFNFEVQLSLSFWCALCGVIQALLILLLSLLITVIRLASIASSVMTLMLLTPWYVYACVLFTALFRLR